MTARPNPYDAHPQPADPIITLIGKASPEAPSESWIDWREAPPDYVAMKALPDERHYFIPNYETMLFPTGRTHRRRVRLDVGRLILKRGPTETQFAIELLEHQRVHLTDNSVLGQLACHLRWEMGREDDLQELPQILNEMRSALLSPGCAMTLITDDTLDLGSSRPLRALVSNLGNASLDFDPYVITGADRPADADARAWRRALARAISVEQASATIAADPSRADALESRLGPNAMCVLGRGAALAPTSAAHHFNQAEVRYLRSYWAEALGIGLLQIAAVDDVSRRLADVHESAPAQELERLYADWLQVRQRLWWSHPSSTTEVPAELLRLLQQESRSAERYTDLDTDFSVFVAQRRRRRDEAQARALANLQIWGAGLATTATASGVAGVLLSGNAPSDETRSVVALLIVAIGAVVGLLVRRRVRA